VNAPGSSAARNHASCAMSLPTVNVGIESTSSKQPHRVPVAIGPAICPPKDMEVSLVIQMDARVRHA
jgi:hypothetical protein